MPVANFRFYAELNDFLLPERRFTEFAYGFLDVATVKDRIESFGVPHTEVDLILVNGQSVDFACRLQDGDRISVYPVFEAFDIAGLTCPWRIDKIMQRLESSTNLPCDFLL